MISRNARWSVKKRYGLLEIGENDRVTSAVLLGEFYKWKVEVTEAALKNDSALMAKISENAVKKGKTMAQALHDEAVREVAERYGLPDLK